MPIYITLQFKQISIYENFTTEILYDKKFYLMYLTHANTFTENSIYTHQVLNEKQKKKLQNKSYFFGFMWQEDII
jgi:hypothetical protein